jgi:hypothetical protein
MEKPKSRTVIIVAILQFIPPLILPLSVLASPDMSIILVQAIVLDLLSLPALWGMLTSRGWARVLTIFVQGFNLIARLLILFPNAINSDGHVDLAFILTSVISIAFSAVLLYSIDKPEIEAIFEF